MVYDIMDEFNDSKKFPIVNTEREKIYSSQKPKFIATIYSALVRFQIPDFGTYYVVLSKIGVSKFCRKTQFSACESLRFFLLMYDAYFRKSKTTFRLYTEIHQSFREGSIS